jgi:hypothetical protein
MAITVSFDEKLRARLGGAESMELASATTVHGVLLQVGKAYPALHMFNCDGELRGTLKVRRDGQFVAVTEPVQDGETLELVLG